LEPARERLRRRTLEGLVDLVDLLESRRAGGRRTRLSLRAMITSSPPHAFLINRDSFVLAAWTG
jgi:hypothetical protein